MIRPPAHRRAFTVLELLLVLVVIAVVGVLVLPNIGTATASGRLESQTRATLALARKAHAQAAMDGRVYLLVVDAEKREMRLARRRDPLAEASPDEDDPELEVPETQPRWAQPIRFYDDVQLEQVTLGADEEDYDLASEPLKIAFQPSGEADEARLVFKGAKDERRIVRVDGVLGVARILPSEEVEQ